jgi:hypothetical protein
MELRWIASRVTLSVLSAFTGVVGVYATAGLVSFDHRGHGGNGASHCSAERCCFVCDTSNLSPVCTPVEWEEDLGDFDEYCTSMSHSMGAGGSYSNTRGGCQSNAQCNTGNMPNCNDGFDNDFDSLTDREDPDCALGMWETTYNEITNISLEISGPTEAERGETVTYEIELKNNSNSPAESVDIFGTFGLNFEYVGPENNSCSILQQSFSCYGLRVEAKEEINIEFIVKLLDEQPACGASAPSIYASAFNSSGLQHNSYGNEGEIRTFIPCTECADGIDNDENGRWDFPFDEGCSSKADDEEESEEIEGNETVHIPECQDGLDNNGNGRWDFPFDEGCSSPEDTEEDASAEHSAAGQNVQQNRGNGNGMQHRNTGGNSDIRNMPPPQNQPHGDSGEIQNRDTGGNSDIRNMQRFEVPRIPEQNELPLVSDNANRQEEKRVRELQEMLRERQLRNAVNTAGESQRNQSLGCFTSQGIWTEDRSLCDTGQERHVAGIVRNPAAFDDTFGGQGQPSDEEMRNALRRRFVGGRQYTNVLGVLHDLREKLQHVQSKGNMDQNSEQFVRDTLAWVQSEIGVYTTQSFSMENIDATVSTAQALVPQLASIVQKPENSPDIQHIIQRIEIVLSGAYDSFQVLFANQITVDTSIISEYQRASAVFIDVQSRCYYDRDACGDLQNVLEIIEPMLESMQQTVDSSGNSAVEAEIQSIFNR